MKNRIVPIGTWGYITGSRKITEEKWKESFPQNWFGKVIGYTIKNKLIVRCYRKNHKHPHLEVEPKYFKNI